jgi:hypothetical protein
LQAAAILTIADHTGPVDKVDKGLAAKEKAKAGAKAS